MSSVIATDFYEIKRKTYKGCLPGTCMVAMSCAVVEVREKEAACPRLQDPLSAQAKRVVPDGDATRQCLPQSLTHVLRHGLDHAAILSYNPTQEIETKSTFHYRYAEKRKTRI